VCHEQLVGKLPVPSSFHFFCSHTFASSKPLAPNTRPARSDCCTFLSRMWARARRYVSQLNCDAKAKRRKEHRDNLFKCKNRMLATASLAKQNNSLTTKLAPARKNIQ
jgi:hypothetical protein